jgi:ribonuclease P protein component
MVSNNRFPKSVRLLRASEFERVFAARSSAVDSSIALYGAVNELGYPRLGLVVSRRIGGAPQRNRWKRLLREAFRLTQSQMPPLDLVCVVRAEIPRPLGELKESLLQHVTRIEHKLQEVARRSTRNIP